MPRAVGRPLPRVQGAKEDAEAAGGRRRAEQFAGRGRVRHRAPPVGARRQRLLHPNGAGDRRAARGARLTAREAGVVGDADGRRLVDDGGGEPRLDRRDPRGGDPPRPGALRGAGRVRRAVRRHRRAAQVLDAQLPRGDEDREEARQAVGAAAARGDYQLRRVAALLHLDPARAHLHARAVPRFRDHRRRHLRFNSLAGAPLPPLLADPPPPTPRLARRTLPLTTAPPPPPAER